MRPAARSRSQAQPDAAVRGYTPADAVTPTTAISSKRAAASNYGALRILGAGVVELPVKDAAGTTDIDAKKTCPAGIGRDRIRLC